MKLSVDSLAVPQFLPVETQPELFASNPYVSIEHNPYEVTYQADVVKLFSELTIEPPSEMHRITKLLQDLPGFKELYGFNDAAVGQDGGTKGFEFVTPTAAGLNLFKAKRLEPLGATDFVFRNATSEQLSKKDLSARQIVQAAAVGMFLIEGTHGGMWLHDSVDHAPQAAMLPKRTMNVFRLMAGKVDALWQTDPQLAYHRSVLLASALDYATESFNNSFYAGNNQQHTRGTGLQVLSLLVGADKWNMQKLAREDSAYFSEQIEAADMAVADNHVIWERDNIVQHHENIRIALQN